MDRRKFILQSTVSGIGFISLLNAPMFFQSLGIDGNKSVVNDNDSFLFNETTISELLEKMQKGILTSEQLTSEYIKRIEEIDKKGPVLNSIIELNPDAMNIAKQMDADRKSGSNLGPLHGIPVLIKDNINTADKMMTTAGSLALVGNRATHDAFIVKLLREAGAVILGKTNLSEWANFRSTRSVSGWSSRGGQTKNPYILDRSPCGSSSGSAVAVAANLCVVAVGTETDGSIACPASMNGIVGIKPTVGLVSRSGIIPISKTQDTGGPFARTVKDAAILLSVMAAVDIADAITNESKGKSHKDYTVFLNANGLKGKRIGVEKSFLKKHEMIDPLLKKALDQMSAQGATIVEVEYMKKYHEVEGEELKVLEYEFKDGLNKYLASGNAKPKSLKDIIEFNSANAEKVMPYFRQELMDSTQVKGDLNTPEYVQAVAKMQSTVRKAIDDIMNENKLDALGGPATGAAWCVDFVNGDNWPGYDSYSPAAVAGYPSVTVPMGDINGLPIGLSFLSGAYKEDKLLEIAYAYEQVSKNRKKPEFKKTFSER